MLAGCHGGWIKPCQLRRTLGPPRFRPAVLVLGPPVLVNGVGHFREPGAVSGQLDDLDGGKILRAVGRRGTQGFKQPGGHEDRDIVGRAIQHIGSLLHREARGWLREQRQQCVLLVVHTFQKLGRTGQAIPNKLFYCSASTRPAHLKIAWQPDAAGPTLPWLMKSLLELVRACQRSKTLEARLRFAEAVVGEVGPAMEKFIARRLRSDLVEDACQETLIAIATGLEHVTAKTDQACWGWCYGIALHKSTNQWRAAGKHPALSLDLSEVQEGLEAVMREESIPAGERLDQDWALQMLKALKPPCADLLWERHGLGLSFAQIGEMHGLTPAAARMAVNRAMASARELLAKTR